MPKKQERTVEIGLSVAVNGVVVDYWMSPARLLAFLLKSNATDEYVNLLRQMANKAGYRLEKKPIARQGGLF